MRNIVDRNWKSGSTNLKYAVICLIMSFFLCPYGDCWIQVWLYSELYTVEYYWFLHLNITGFYTWILLVSTPEYYWFLHLNITGFYTWILLVSTPEYYWFLHQNITGFYTTLQARCLGPNNHTCCNIHIVHIGLELWCLLPLSTIFQLFRGGVLLVEETGVPRENHWPAASHRQTLSHNVASSTPRLSGILTHNVSGDRHWLHMLLEIQLPYDHDYDGPLISTQEKPTPVTAQIFFVPLVTGKWSSTIVFIIP
jgi:hypothetical protein